MPPGVNAARLSVQHNPFTEVRMRMVWMIRNAAGDLYAGERRVATLVPVLQIGPDTPWPDGGFQLDLAAGHYVLDRAPDSLTLSSSEVSESGTGDPLWSPDRYNALTFGDSAAAAATVREKNLEGAEVFDADLDA